MTEMINRVAKAIARSLEDRASIEFDRERRPDVMIDHTPFIPDAIAAIEAMLDPTEKMIDVGDAALDYRNDKACDPIHNDDALQIAFARAILAERERCAKVALSVQDRSDWYNGAYDGVQDVIDGINNS